jgi:hypothetical protein
MEMEFLEIKRVSGVAATVRFYPPTSGAVRSSAECVGRRECRTLLESVDTALVHSGAPANLWGEAAAHYTYTRNHIPKHEEVAADGKRSFVSHHRASCRE